MVRQAGGGDAADPTSVPSARRRRAAPRRRAMNCSGSPGAEFGSTDRRNATEPRTDLNHPRNPRNSRRSRSRNARLRGSTRSSFNAAVPRRAQVQQSQNMRAPDLRRLRVARPARTGSRRDVVRGVRRVAVPRQRAHRWRAAAAKSRRTRRPPRAVVHRGGDGFAHQDGFARLDVARRAQHAAFLPFQVLRDVQQPRVQVQACDLSAPRRNASAFCPCST